MLFSWVWLKNCMWNQDFVPNDFPLITKMKIIESFLDFQIIIGHFPAHPTKFPL